MRMTEQFWWTTAPLIHLFSTDAIIPHAFTALRVQYNLGCTSLQADQRFDEPAFF